MVVVHNHPTENANSGSGFLLGVILLIIFVLFLLYYGLPLIRNTATPQLNVPSKIDVNVNQK